MYWLRMLQKALLCGFRVQTAFADPTSLLWDQTTSTTLTAMRN
jgi:hypothetical protein